MLAKEDLLQKEKDLSHIEANAAAAVFRAACNLDPASHMSLFYLHSTYYRDMNTDFDAAIKCLNEAVQIAPTDGLINFFLGMLLDYKGQEEKAEAARIAAE